MRMLVGVVKVVEVVMVVNVVEVVKVVEDVLMGVFFKQLCSLLWYW